MTWTRVVACVLLLATGSVVRLHGAAPQGIPGSRAYFEGRAGWDAIREGRHQDAADAFARALQAESGDPSLHLGAGLAAHLLGHTTAARQSLERALSLAPSLTAASLLLGDILYKGSDLAGAVQVYEAALQFDPDDNTLHERLEAMRREAALHTNFFASHGTHFTVLFEGPADEALATRAIEILEGAYWRVSTALAIYPEGLITVVLYTKEQFRDVTRSPQWAAAAYDGRIRIPARGAETDLRELERVLIHEFTHALVQSLRPRGVPTWLHEGLAVMFEPEGSAWTEKQLSSSSTRLPLPKLSSSFGELSGVEARAAYAQSAGMVRAMLDSGGAAAVGALLQDMASGDAFAVAFERRFFMTLDAFVAGLDTTP